MTKINYDPRSSEESKRKKSVISENKPKRKYNKKAKVLNISDIYWII